MKFNIHGYTAILVFLGGGSDRYNAGCNGITGQGNSGGSGSPDGDGGGGGGGGGAGSAGNSALGTGQ